MIILRQCTFSSKKDLKKNLRDAAVAGGALGVVAGAAKTQASIGTKFMKDLDREVDSGEKAVAEKLIKKSEKNGAKVIRDKTGMYFGPASTKDVVYLHGTKAPSIVAHEAGHHHYFNVSPKKTKKISDYIGKGAIKSYGVSKILTPLSVPVVGISSGIKKAVDEDKGKKQSKFNKHAAWAAPLVANLPVLVSEGLASRHGLKAMKAAGATKAAMKTARKELLRAGTTYAANAAAHAGAGQLTKEVAYHLKKRDLEADKRWMEEYNKNRENRENREKK